MMKFGLSRAARGIAAATAAMASPTIVAPRSMVTVED